MNDDRFSRLDYCQYLLSSPLNYTLTHLADHLEGFSHDTLNRYLRNEKLTPRLLWEQVKDQIEGASQGYLIFDDTVLDHRFGPAIEGVRRQWSGNERRIIRGIGLVSCVYVRADTGEFFVIDYRVYDPERDGRTKLDHAADMLQMAHHRQAPFDTVLMDTWYATRELMLLIDGLGKRFYCPIRSNRYVDDSGGARPYQRVDTLEWTPAEAMTGRAIKIKGFPKDYKVRLFRVAVSSHRTDWVVTNDPTCTTTQAAQEASRLRWKVEEFHREAKQLTGIEQCQCRKGRIQRNHIACALLVWTRLKALAYQSGLTVYQIKHGLLHDYLVQQLKAPTVRMALA